MGFGINNKELAVFESRLQIYEDLSERVLSKLERAIDKITESNRTIIIILKKHESESDRVPTEQSK